MKIIKYNTVSGSSVEIRCTVDTLESNEAIAKVEAYNGEYIIEDDGQPEPVSEPTTDEILNTLLGVTE